MEEDKYWTYEVKCRRCGKVHTAIYGLKNVKLKSLFESYMEDCLNTPKQVKCIMCNKKTVHDIISY